jgi:hypothetical protein
MKVSIVFLLLACSLIIKENFGDKTAVKNNKSEENYFVTLAIGEIIEKFYAEDNHRVDVLCFPCKDKKFFDLLNEIPRKGKNEITFRVVKAKEKIQINGSTIMLFDTKADHDKFVMNITFDWDSTVDKFHIVYYPSYANVETVLGRLAFKNVNYIGNNNKTHLALFTFEYFIENSCSLIQRKIINFFSKITQKWQKNDSFFPDEYKNFHGCAVNYGRSTIDVMNLPPRKGNKFGGQLYELNEAITKKLNVQSSYWYCPLNMTIGGFVCVENPSIQLVMVFSLYYINEPHESLRVLQPFNFNNVAGFLIPPGEFLSVPKMTFVLILSH